MTLSANLGPTVVNFLLKASKICKDVVSSVLLKMIFG